jgi:hypothetical protein
MPSEKKERDRGAPDAVLYPDSYKAEAVRAMLAGVERKLEPGEGTRLRMRGVQDKLAPVLGGQAWHTDVGGGWHMATLEPHPTFLLPQDHPTRPKQPKYEWVDQPDGTRHGYLLPDEPDEDVSVQATKPIRRRGKAPTVAEVPDPNPEDPRPAHES